MTRLAIFARLVLSFGPRLAVAIVAPVGIVMSHIHLEAADLVARDHLCSQNFMVASITVTMPEKGTEKGKAPAFIPFVAKILFNTHHNSLCKKKFFFGVIRANLFSSCMSMLQHLSST